MHPAISGQEAQRTEDKRTQKRLSEPLVFFLGGHKTKSVKHGFSLKFYILCVVLLFLISLLFPNSWAIAKIFRYIDSNGIIHLSNAPRNQKYQEWKDIPEINTDRIRKPLNKNKDKITKLVEVASRKYGIDSKLINAIIKTESNFNPEAISARGAIGLMQLMPETAQLYGIRDPFDPWENIQGGVQHLDYLLNLFNHDLNLVLAAYNAGDGQVEKYDGIPPFPETIDYINKVVYYYNNPVSLQSDRAPDHHKVKGANKIFRFVSPDNVVLFTNVYQ